MIVKAPPPRHTDTRERENNNYLSRGNSHVRLQCVVVCCSVLQCVAVCCSVLQCVAVCCSVMQRGTYLSRGESLVRCVMQCVVVWCSAVQIVAVWCSVLQCGADCCSVM